LKPKVEKGIKHSFDDARIVKSQYRPFTKQWFYFDGMFNHRPYRMNSLFPKGIASNVVISLTGRGSTKEFSAFVSNVVPDLEMISKGQCFPLKVYGDLNEEAADDTNDMFASPTQNATLKDGITDEGLKHFTDAYNGASISKEDLFYYIYGLLHSEEYKVRYTDNLSKELPRIPAVKKFDDFMAFSAAGRKLADLHLNYETVEPYAVNIEGGALLLSTFTDSDYYVTQMKFASKADKSTVIYNHKITMHNIPVEAYEYVVNGKPALEWVMERQAVTTHKDSGIVNDANLWAKETMGDAAYPLKLFQRVITVSLETMKIVKALPKLEIKD
jgi:predicted helicase